MSVWEGKRADAETTNVQASPQLRSLVGDYTTFNRQTCDCGRNHVRAMGSFTGRADDLINLRSVKFFPSQIEQAVRTVDGVGVGDEFEILLSTNDDGLHVMGVRVEHAHGGDAIAEAVASEIRTHCEVRATVEVPAPNTLPKTEFEAKRVRHERAE